MIEELEDVERRMSRFLRRSGLSEKEERALARWNPAVDEKKINADYKDGVLNVHISKGTNVKSKSVEVKVS